MSPVRRLSPVLLALTIAALVAAVTAGPAAPAPPAQSGDPCAAIANESVQCGPGNGRQTVGGGEKVSHKGWPRITGVLAKVLDSSSRTLVGGAGSRDLAQIRENGAFKTRNCELIRHFCQFGSRPNGDCKQPGERLAARAARRSR